MTQEHGRTATEQIHTPETSYWPVVLAATLTLIMVGVLVNLVISAVGAVLSVVAMVAWAAQRFQGPSEAHAASRERPALPVPGEGVGVPQVPVEISRSPGWWGLVWFIATEAVFFGNLVAGYIYLRASSTIWPPAGTPQVDLLFPVANTIILLLSGVPAYYAQRAIRKGDRRGLQLGLILAAVLGAIFLAGQVYEYTTLGLALPDNMFAAGFYVLTGFHGAHVVAGIGLLLVVLWFSTRGRYSAASNFGVDVASTYWHFVDVVWIFLFTTLYVVR